MRIEYLNLSPTMEQRARELQAVYPFVEYTSGRRTITQQASAMAVNIVRADDRQWIAKTYRNGARLQRVVDTSVGVLAVGTLTHALMQEMRQMPPDELYTLSKHFQGDAVDLQPLEDEWGIVTADGAHVVDWIRACPDTTQFLKREGGLRRWHWSCAESQVI
jgi:hypothetical protein